MFNNDFFKLSICKFYVSNKATIVILLKRLHGMELKENKSMPSQNRAIALNFQTSI